MHINLHKRNNLKMISEKKTRIKNARIKKLIFLIISATKVKLTSFQNKQIIMLYKGRFL